MTDPTTSGPWRTLAASLIIALTLTGLGRAVAATHQPADPVDDIAGLHAPICHSGSGPSTEPAVPPRPPEHDCCGACALLAPVVLPAAPSVSGPAGVGRIAAPARAAAWMPALARARSPRQARGPPAA